MPKILALNIETGANLALADSLPEPEVKYGNTKDPLKREAKDEEAKLAQRSKMALDAHFGTVLCVGFAYWQEVKEEEVAGQPHVTIREPKVVIQFAGKALPEAKLLAWAWKQIAAADQLVTFNGAGFDIPFMLRRSTLLNVRPETYVEMSKYHVNMSSAHADLMQILQQSETGTGLGIPRTLSFYVKQFLGDDFPFSDLDQSRLTELLAEENGYQKIHNLCAWNVRSTLILFSALQGIYQ